MSIQTALDEYNLALKQGQKEYRELVMEGLSPWMIFCRKIIRIPWWTWGW